MRPGVVLAPSLVENQHPDHYKLGRLVRDAARLARYGGLKKLKANAPHSIGPLFFYVVTPEAEPAGRTSEGHAGFCEGTTCRPAESPLNPDRHAVTQPTRRAKATPSPGRATT